MRNTILSLQKILNHSGFLIFAIVLLTAFYTTKADRNYGWTKSHKEDKTPIFNDGAGYYAWAPKWFLHRSDTSDFLFLKEIADNYPGKNFTGSIIWPDGKHTYNKYYTGVAVAVSPFFGMGHLVAKIYNVPQDGYSWPYQMFVVFSGIFYFFIGLVAVSLLLRRMAISNFWIVVCLCIIALGSNLSFYVYEYAPYSHVYSFAFCALFVLFSKIWADTGKVRNILILSVILGMIFIIRPTNSFIVFVLPFLFPSFRAFFDAVIRVISKHILILLLAVTLFGCIVFFQLWSNYTQNGEWTFNTYFLETFEFLTNPKIVEVFFSFRKGLFVYSPVLLLIFPGLFALYRSHRMLFWGILLQFGIFTYITAAWWCWWYGGGLGMRPMLDILVIFIIPIAFLLQHSKTWLKVCLLIFIGLTIKLERIYEFQIVNNMIHYDNMDAEKFRRVFLHTEARFGWGVYQEYDHLPKGSVKEGPALMFDYNHTKMKTGQEVSVTSDDISKIPFLRYYPKSKKGYFGAHVNAEVKIYTDEENPGFRVYYFKQGEVRKEQNFVVGSFIPQKNRFAEISLDVFPKLRNSGFDSLHIHYVKFRDSATLRNVIFQPYIFDKKSGK